MTNLRDTMNAQSTNLQINEEKIEFWILSPGLQNDNLLQHSATVYGTVLEELAIGCFGNLPEIIKLN